MNIVCCAGGGLRGAFEGGAIEALLDAGIAIDGWGGVSTGSIQAGYMALAPAGDIALQRAQLARLKILWLALRRPLTDPWWKVLWRLATLKPSLHSGDPLQKLLGQAIPSSPSSSVLAPILAPALLGAVDLVSTHFGAALAMRVLSLRDAIRASCAVPLLFPPVIGLVDGGVRSVAPLRAAFDLIRAIAPPGSPRAAEPVTIYLLLTLPLAVDGTPTDPAPMAAGSFKRIWQVALRCVDILQTDDYQKDLAGAVLFNDLVALAATTAALAAWPKLQNKRAATIITIAPETVPYGMLELNPPKLAAFWQHGYARAKAAT